MLLNFSRLKMKNHTKEYIDIIKSFWLSKDSLSSWAYLSLLLIINGCLVYFMVYINKLQGDLFDFVELKDKSSIIQNITELSVVVVCAMILFSLIKLFTSLVHFKWRKAMTNQLISRWLNSKCYLYQKAIVDNPDQRISDDVNYFCESCITVFLDIFTQILTAGSFFIILWNFSVPFHFSFYGHEYTISHYLAWLCLGYAFAINVFMFWMGKPIVRLDFQQKKVEADFRYSLIRFRDHAEEIAFKKGEPFEQTIFDHKFSFIKTNYYKLMKFKFFMTLTQYGYISTLSFLPIIASLPLYLSDLIGFGALMQINGACAQVLAALGILVTSYQSLALLHAAKNRLWQFLYQSQDELSTENSNYQMSEKNEFVLENVTIFNQNKEPIVKNLSFNILDGEKVLLMGKSGLGKTSILRSLSKIWHKTQGSIRLPKDEIFFIPQKPYFPLSKLKDCLLYPHGDITKIEESKLSEVLKDVHLSDLIPLLNEEKDWSRYLSPGQQQRINFAKILIRKPKILVMDEPTSSLDEFHENEMFKLLNKKIFKGATILTISHSSALKTFHDRYVEMA